jgi:hypothetical protein
MLLQRRLIPVKMYSTFVKGMQFLFSALYFQIVSFILMRNVPGWLRTKYSSFFAWFGKISLEVSIEEINRVYHRERCMIVKSYQRMSQPPSILRVRVRVMVFNATFKQVTDKLYHIMLY